MNDELKRHSSDPINILSQHLPAATKEIHKTPSIRTAGVPADIQIDLPNPNQRH
jgi:hypothetical protein